MRRAATLVALGSLFAALATPIADAGHPPRRHRLILPDPELPTALAVDEAEYTMRPSQTEVAAGPVTVHVYNRGMDDHDVLFHDAAGGTHTAYLTSGSSTTLKADLKPGSYTFVCSLFAGTPQSHEALGMHFVLKVT